MVLSKLENEDALDLLADILEPTANVFSDETLIKLVRGGGRPIDAVKHALKNHKSEILEILARIDGVEPADYRGTIITMTRDLLEIMNDKELMSFFSSQGQTTVETSSGSATESTKAEKK